MSTPVATPVPAVNTPSSIQGVGNPTSSLAAPARSQKDNGATSFGTFGVCLCFDPSLQRFNLLSR